MSGLPSSEWASGSAGDDAAGTVAGGGTGGSTGSDAAVMQNAMASGFMPELLIRVPRTGYRAKPGRDGNPQIIVTNRPKTSQLHSLFVLTSRMRRQAEPEATPGMSPE
jgi:hypothetical protein